VKRRKGEVLLQDWFVRFLHLDDVYVAPECRHAVLAGEVYGHPRFPDGYPVKTSAVEKVEGRLITTRGGTVYRLGRISKKYRAWLKKEGRVYNPRQPITIKDCEDKKGEEHGDI
jgi:hypothetical protein